MVGADLVYWISLAVLSMETPTIEPPSPGSSSRTRLPTEKCWLNCLLTRVHGQIPGFYRFRLGLIMRKSSINEDIQGIYDGDNGM